MVLPCLIRVQVFVVKAAMQNALGFPEIPTTLIFTHRTIRATAAALAEVMAAGNSATAAISPRSWEGPIRPLSTNQEQMWLLYQCGLTSAYNMPSAICFKGNVNVRALQAAFNQVAARHEVLRSGFCSRKEGFLSSLQTLTEVAFLYQCSCSLISHDM